MRRDLPTGTVTFLFTDVEGSTKLLHELGAEGYAEALADHRQVIREATAAEGGVEVDTQGDAFFFAFPTAPGAIAAAEAMTEALAPGTIQVRVGLHTGTPLLTDEGYVGDDVHFAARVASSGHGGQVILSRSTAELVEIELTDLGEHRLKDIADAVPIFQLGDGPFPPLKTISNTNLPRPASSFVGRADELLEVLSRFEEGARLVTLTGPGGTGKTRLAIEAAASLVPEYKAGVFWVGLATLRDPALVTETIAQTLGAKDGLADHIGDREMLLLVDNLEQLIDCASDLSELLTACPNLTLLVTSRELLRIQGEVEYAVPPLAEPEAVSLFCERSQLEPSEDIAELCSRLDSLPLAVELAAARTSALTPEQILERLSQRLDLLKGGRDADPRQETLRATIEWSYELLPPEEQQLFARLSMFIGGCTLEAAEEVAGADLDTIQSLVEKSLLRFTDGRYWMFETILEYAAERLAESDEAEDIRQRHASFFGAMAQGTAATALASLDARAIERFEIEHPNIRVAVAWALQRREYEFVLHLIWRLWTGWIARGHAREGLRWSEVALAGTNVSEAREEALAAASELARWAGDEERAVELKQELLALAQEHGLYKPWLRSIALADLCDMALLHGEATRAYEYARESLEAAEGNPAAEARAQASLGEVALFQGDLDRAHVLFQASADGFAGTHEFNYAAVLEAWGEVERRRGHHRHAAELFMEALQTFAELGDQAAVAECLEGLAHIAGANGDEARALRLAELTDALRAASGTRPWRPERAFGAHPDERRIHAVETTLEEMVEYALAAID